jgi:hypothetical protein
VSAEEIARLRAEAARLAAEAYRLHDEALRALAAGQARVDQHMAAARDAADRANRSWDAAGLERLPYQPPRTRANSRARSAWIRRDILAALEAEAPLPVSTPHLVDRLCLQHEYATVLRLLNSLAKAGEVEKWHAGETRCCYWRRW